MQFPVKLGKHFKTAKQAQKPLRKVDNTFKNFYDKHSAAQNHYLQTDPHSCLTSSSGNILHELFTMSNLIMHTLCIGYLLSLLLSLFYGKHQDVSAAVLVTEV